jgi:hypothetical protein
MPGNRNLLSSLQVDQFRLKDNPALRVFPSGIALCTAVKHS